VAWDWHQEASNRVWFDPVGWLGQVGWLGPASKTRGQGNLLGQALLSVLGPNYSLPIHFVGHSMGTMVNAGAADYLHLTPSKGVNAFLPSHTQMTLLDEADLSAEPINYLLSIMLAELAHEPDPVLPFWYKPLPKQAAWIDNYISAVGLPHKQAANVILTRLTNGAEDFYYAPDFSTWYSAAVSFHHYPCAWYDLSVLDTNQIGLMGEQSAFERAGFSGAPGANSFLVQANTGPELNLTPIDFGSATSFLISRLLKEADAFTLSIVESVENPIIQKVGQVAAQVTETLTQDAYALSSSLTQAGSMIINLTTSLAGGPFAGKSEPQPLDGGSSTNTPAYAWIPLAVPSNAVSMSFDFTFQGNGQQDSFVAAVNGSNVFSLEAILIETNVTMNSGLINVSPWAGQGAELFLGIVGGTSSDASVAVSGIRFYFSVPPSLQAQVSGSEFVITWPLTAAKYVVEATDKITVANSWNSLTNVPAIVNFRNTITNAVSGTGRFYRLRKQ